MKASLTPEQLRSGRQAAGLTQQQAADRLGVSQAYLALIESGRRPLTSRLLPAVASLYGFGPAALPLATDLPDDSRGLAAAVASLGYPGFGRSSKAPQNPAAVLLAAIAATNVEVRVLEALPWLAIQYSHLDWDWLIREAKLRDLQNRLGFIVTLARRVAETRGDDSVVSRLLTVEAVLERARLAREDTLCQASLSTAERRWLRTRRPREARHWNLLTDLTAGVLRYAA
jgi:transcriptional regulator with XRE-family HTH domain